MSVFAKYEKRAYPFQFNGTLVVHTMAGGVPSDPKVAEGWIRTKLADKDDLVREAVAEAMLERGISAEEAAAEIDHLKHLNGFRRGENGQLYIPGYYLKACLKEAASVARAVGKLPDRWGLTRKGIQSFVAEHVCVTEDRLYLGVTEPTGIAQRFVHAKGPQGPRAGIQYEEYVEDAKIDFTVLSDFEFSDEQWAMLWLTAQEQGIGATRSQGYGRFTVERWERLK